MKREYRDGTALYGDAFNSEQIEEWFRAEEKGYFELAGNRTDYRYSYHALNAEHHYRAIRGQKFPHCLSIGCATGDELLPLEGQIGHIYALEPAEEWWRDSIGTTKATYLKPTPSGDIPLPNASVDLVTCFGVLHHIPNVSRILAEIGRVMKPGGTFLLREPVHSMGDWTKPRRGLTQCERGISDEWMKGALARSGFEIVSRVPCVFPASAHIAQKLGVAVPHNSMAVAKFDRVLSWLFQWNRHYHRDRLWKKLAPGSSAYVLRRAR